jgi:hypothetical protein
MKLYKLTDQKMQTYGDFQWELNKTYYIKGPANRLLCTSGVFHAYKSIELALLLNPIHANISDPRCFESKGQVVIEDYGKVGTKELTLTRSRKLPRWYSDLGVRYKVQVQFAILCAEVVYKCWEQCYPDDSTVKRAIEAAKRYLINPCKEAARVARAAAYAAADAADAAHAAYAAYAAARAAHAAAHAAYAAARAAHAAAHAAYAAARAAARAGTPKINFNKLAKQAVKEINK